MPIHAKNQENFTSICESDTKKHFSIADAMGSVPQKDFKKVKRDIMGILKITSRVGFQPYMNGKGVSDTPYWKVKEVEEYFRENYKIKDVWKEIQPK